MGFVLPFLLVCFFFVVFLVCKWQAGAAEGGGGVPEGIGLVPEEWQQG